MEKRNGKHRENQLTQKKWGTLGACIIIVIMIIGGYWFINQDDAQQIMSQIGISSADREAEVSRIEQQRLTVLAEANRCYLSYDYDGAIKLLNQNEDIKNEQFEILIAEYTLAKDQLIKYEGLVHHVFFHSLIVYPELAFDGDYRATGYNMWMTTKDEFIAMLPKLQERGYVLYDIEQLVTHTPDGQVVPKEIWLPAGKIPMVISIDDVCYYDYMQTDGFAQRLTVNGQGDVVTVVKDLQGVEHETYDGDVMPIVDQYVKKHPEFSYQGAKGVVAVTGYQGAFGYRITDLQGEELQQAIDKTKAVAEALKASGWKIANHSYTHNGYFRDETVTMSQLISDTTRWKQFIEPAVGETSIYISPFGVHFDKMDERFRYLVDQGYAIYCPVAASMTSTFNGDNMVQNRLNLDGYTMFKKPELVKSLYFDVNEVIDPLRPSL